MRFLDKLNTHIAVLVTLGFFLGLDGFLFYGYQQALPPVNDAPASAEEITASPTSEAPPGLRVGVRVVDAPARLSIEEDGTPVLDEKSAPGFSREFEADEVITISTDNAGAVRVEDKDNGQDLGSLGKSGQAGSGSVHRIAS
jgi:hypothetical protein